MRPKSNTEPKGKSFAEFRMRKLLRELYPFHEPKFNHRPKWLSGCELDVFYPALNLAFEFNGKQHYEFHKTYHRTLADFDAQVERDRFKTAECRSRGIRVIAVRYAHLADADVIRSLILGLPVDDNLKWRGEPRPKPAKPERKQRRQRCDEKAMAAWKAARKDAKSSKRRYNEARRARGEIV